MATSGTAFESLRDRSRVAVLMEHPLRLAIVHAASAPGSATEIAAGLGVSRQRVNYHIGRLRRAGFLVPAGRRKRRGFIEQRYAATAQGYVVDSKALGPVGVRVDQVQDRLSADYLVALSAQLQDELGEVIGKAARQGKRVATMSLSAEIRFTSPAQRTRFAQALQHAVAQVVARHSAPAQTSDGKPLTGRVYRLMVGCYPPPAPDPHRTD